TGAADATRAAGKKAASKARKTTASGKRQSRQARTAVVSDEHQELKAAAAAGDGAAAFTLWERLRDADNAAAEGWLQTAVELGDVRAAHRLGMLLWERREIDA